MAEKRPNILFAFADDWGRYASAYRQVEGDGTPNALLDTPNFDRIAREGVLFTNAFVPAPSCTPCRSSILTGRYFWQTGLGSETSLEALSWSCRYAASAWGICCANTRACETTMSAYANLTFICSISDL